ncbi:endonuclease/exonuclease/phosphatase family metal-dependent hydrolase [Pedobacter sp. UYP30]|uniref:endonuclease/exonuclease/phosphatase family protein n=1 Tax=Pedobacter sp. UYP30 TaxID=1756400 RepID=UPI003393424B
MAKRKYSFFDKFLLPIAIVFAISLVMGIFAGVVDPRKLPMIAFFGLAYPYVLVINLIVIAWWIISKKYTFAILTLTIIILGYRPLRATFSFSGDEGSAQKPENSIRLMTYNVHNFQPFDDKKTESAKEKMLQVVKDQNPDVVCFQEFYTRFKGKFDIIDSLKKQLDIKNVYFVKSTKNEYEANGLAIFSRFPIVAQGEIPFLNGLKGNMCIYTDLNVSGKILRVYNVHFQSISFQPQDYEYLNQVKDMDTKVRPIKRILRMLKRAFEKRSGQVDIMKSEMASCKTPYLIAGDFNDTPASYVVTQITKGLNSAFVKKGIGLGKTYNGKFPNFQIDYIATSKDLQVLNYNITEAKLSDHFPVRSDLRFK